MKKYVRGTAIVGVLTLAVAACGSKPTEENTGGSANKDFKACMVSDSGGFDDKSFNQTSYKGLQDAVKEKGLTEVKAESKSDNDYPTNMTAMVNAKCNVIVAVGFKLEDATEAAAKANPDIKFAIVDSAPAPGKELPNLKPLLFNTAQSSFQAGYLAAAMSQSGKVGTFGGIKIPTVTIFMDGFAEGVKYYNTQKGKNVQVLGWDDAKQTGLFTNDFEDKAKGQTNAQNLITQGADVLFPVAGPAGLGGLQAAKASNGKVNAIWVDTDGCVSAAEYCPVLMSSVQKGMDVAVKDAIVSVVDNKFDNTQFTGTLDNGGTSLAPFHDFDSKVSADTKKELDQIKADIISGKIKVQSKAQPTAS